ncbi:MAG: 2-hydroxyacyl-CoA dehydratase family protein [Deltaproteobacteria bacterium]|nr:2-hydroxyacyl-CoA dehydratase family protein [Deltaproteobacteria bacterium]
MSNALNIMTDVVQNAPAVLSDIKDRTSSRMIGYFSPVVPEELIAAAGFHPVRLYPWVRASIRVADAHLQTYVCSYVRAAWDQIIQGKHPYIDGAIISRSCEAVTFLYPTWKRHSSPGVCGLSECPLEKK